MLITGQLRISLVWEDVQLMWISKAGPYTALIWPPASIRAMPAWRQEVTLSALLKYACCWQEGLYCRAVKFSTVLRISLAAAHGYEGTLSFSSGHAEQILSQAMEMRHVSKLSVSSREVLVSNSAYSHSALPRDVFEPVLERDEFCSLLSTCNYSELQTDYSAP